MGKLELGRPTKLNDELMVNMAFEISQGLPVKYCCDLFCISRFIFDEWIKQGEKDIEAGVESIHADFYVMIKKAVAEFVRNVGVDIRKGQPGWQGKAWWLERTRPDFMQRQVIETDNKDGKVVVMIGNKQKEKPGNFRKEDNNK